MNEISSAAILLCAMAIGTVIICMVMMSDSIAASKQKGSKWETEQKEESLK